MEPNMNDPNRNDADIRGRRPSPGSDSSPRIIAAVICLVLAVLSATMGASYFSSPDRYQGTIASLDEKRSDVLELTAAATATSVLITAVPGDTATPIAEKFADMIQWFLLVLCAISLEKYLAAVMGLVSFRFLIPGGLVLLAVGVLLRKRSLKKTAGRIMALALILFLLVPASTWVSKIIERTYSYSVDGTLQSAESVQQELQGLTGEDAQEEGREDTQGGNQESASLWDTITGIPSTLVDAAGNAASSITSLSQLPGRMVEELQTLLNQFIESIAYMLITSCVIPILVLLFFVFLLRIVMDGLVGPSVPPIPYEEFFARRK